MRGRLFIICSCEFPFKLVGGRVPLYVRRVRVFFLSHGVLD